MSKQANKTVIGGFVVGAVVLLVAGVLIFGGGAFFTKKYIFVLYFDESVKGLDVGAAVQFRGVKVGSVTDIVLRADLEKMTINIPVFIEIEPHRIEGRRRNGEPVEGMAILVKKGLRAQLQMQSVVTGKLVIALDFHPDEPIRLVCGDPGCPEIPTIPTTLEELSETIKKLNLGTIAENLALALEGIERTVNAPEVVDSISTLNQVLKDAQKLIRNVDSRVDPLASTIEETFRDAQRLVRNVDGEVTPVASGIKSSADAATAALVQAEKALRAIEGVTAEDSVMAYELTNALKELSSAAHSIRVLTDYAEQYPDSVLRGKRKLGGK